MTYTRIRWPQPLLVFAGICFMAGCERHLTLTHGPAAEPSPSVGRSEGSERDFVLARATLDRMLADPGTPHVALLAPDREDSAARLSRIVSMLAREYAAPPSGVARLAARARALDSTLTARP